MADHRHCTDRRALLHGITALAVLCVVWLLPPAYGDGHGEAGGAAPRPAAPGERLPAGER